MNKCIMLGNGINRCIFSNVSWEDLLSTIASKYDVELNENISFPMQFEAIVNQILMKDSALVEKDMYTTIKQEMISTLQSALLPPIAPHKEFVKVSDTIITTNYDYLIESSIDDNFSSDKIPKHIKDYNNKYNLKNSISVLGKEVFHIHGDLRNAKSICLGYEHYSGTVQNLRSNVAQKKDGFPPVVWALKDADKTINSWAEKFFTHNIDIVGLGLTQSEIDIWWLITYRASLYYANRYDCRKLINNTIVYHHIGTAPDVNMKYTLESLAINYKFHSIPKKEDKYFLDKYFEIAKMI